MDGRLSLVVGAILEGKFSSMSDVWSFGIVLVELFQDGDTPWPGLKNAVVVGRVTALKKCVQ